MADKRSPEGCRGRPDRSRPHRPMIQLCPMHQTKSRPPPVRRRAVRRQMHRSRPARRPVPQAQAVVEPETHAVALAAGISIRNCVRMTDATPTPRAGRTTPACHHHRRFRHRTRRFGSLRPQPTPRECLVPAGLQRLAGITWRAPATTSTATGAPPTTKLFVRWRTGSSASSTAAYATTPSTTNTTPGTPPKKSTPQLDAIESSHV